MLFFYNVVRYIDISFFLILNLFIYYKFKKLSNVLRLFGVFTTILFAIALISIVISRIGKFNLPYFHLFLFIQWAWLSTYYLQLHWGKMRTMLAILATLATIYFAIHYAQNWPNVIMQLGGSPYFISNIIFIVYAVVYYFYNLMSKTSLKYPYINAGVIIYFSGSSVIFLFGDYLKVIPLDKQIFLWIFNAILHIAFLALILIEIWKQVYPNKKTLSH